MSKPRSGLIALVLLVVALAGAGALAAFLLDGAGGTHGEPGSSVAGRPSPSGSSRAADSPERLGQESPEPSVDRVTEGTVAPDALAPISPDELRRLEACARAVVFGVVTGPDGAPCAGATVFCCSERVAESDELGRYRAEVDDAEWSAFASRPWSGLVLAAVKDGVGAGMAARAAGSGRVDLAIEWTARFAGRAVESGSHVPVPGARIEMASFRGNEGSLRYSLFRRETVAAEDGSFEFVGFAPGMLELNARAEGFASNGWFPFTVSTRDRVQVDFELEPIVGVRGWFTPWPPPGVTPGGGREGASGDASEARVVLTPERGRDSGPVSDPVSASVDAGGRFELRCPTTWEFDLVLEASGGALWSDRIRLDFERSDVDLGRIVLQRPVALAGRVDLPSDLLDLGVDLAVIAPMENAESSWRFRAGADGCFRAEPLPPGPLLWGVTIGDALIAPDTLRFLDAETGKYAGEAQELFAGTELDLGTLAIGGVVLAGRVTSESGAPAQAVVGVQFGAGDDSIQFNAVTGSSGVFVVSLPDEDPRAGTTSLADLIRATTGPIRARAFAPRSIAAAELAAWPTGAAAARLDLVLGPGRSLRGSLADPAGAPVADALIAFERADEPGASAGEPRMFEGRRLQCRTDASGAFEMTGLADAPYDLFAAHETEKLTRFVELGTTRPDGSRRTFVLKDEE